MAYTAFTPGNTIVFSVDGKSFRIKDTSIWSGESGSTSSCILSIVRVTTDNERITYDNYLLITGVDKTKYNQYLAADGHLVIAANLLIGGVAAPERFIDGYYEITLTFNDGSYPAGYEPHYINTTPCLSRYRCMKRTMPAKLLSWPITDDVRRKNDDIYLFGLYVDAAEHASQIGSMVEFRKYIVVIDKILSNYAIPEPW